MYKCNKQGFFVLAQIKSKQVFYRAIDNKGKLKEYYGKAYCLKDPGTPPPSYSPIALEKYLGKSILLKVGDLIETTDGWVVPVIKVSNDGFRCLNDSGVSLFYKKRDISFGIKQVRFYDDMGYHAIYNNTILSKKQSLFVWYLVHTGDFTKAVQKANLSHSHALFLFTQPKVVNMVKACMNSMLDIIDMSKETFLTKWDKFTDSIQLGLDNAVNEGKGDDIAKIGKVMNDALTSYSEKFVVDTSDTQGIQSNNEIGESQGARVTSFEPVKLPPTKEIESNGKEEDTIENALEARYNKGASGSEGKGPEGQSKAA